MLSVCRVPDDEVGRLIDGAVFVLSLTLVWIAWRLGCSAACRPHRTRRSKASCIRLPAFCSAPPQEQEQARRVVENSSRWNGGKLCIVTPERIVCLFVMPTVTLSDRAALAGFWVPLGKPRGWKFSVYTGRFCREGSCCVCRVCGHSYSNR